jgi:hypothetical protein
MSTRAIIPGPTPTSPHAGTHAVGGTDVFNPDLSQIIGLGSALALKADASGLAAVATSGAYADLSGAPTIPQPANVGPSDLGASSTGSNPTYAHADHSHLLPSLATLGAAGSSHTHLITDVTGLSAALSAKADASALAAKADVSSVPVASSMTPAAVGTAAVGTGVDFARNDHVHALPAVGTAATYGDATHFPIITTDAQGRVTAVTPQLVAGGSSGKTIVGGTVLTATADMDTVDGTGDFTLVALDATSGSITLTLPTYPSGGSGGAFFSRILHLARADATGNTVTIAARSGGSVAGGASITLTTPFQVVSLISLNGNNWGFLGTPHV